MADVPIPVAFGAAFEGERVRGEDIYLETGGGRTLMVEWVTSKRMDEVEDGKIEVIGPELTDVSAGSRLPLAIAVEVAGREKASSSLISVPSSTPNCTRILAGYLIKCKSSFIPRKIR